MTTSAEYAVMDAAKALQDHLNTAPERPTLRDQFAMAALTGLLAAGGLAPPSSAVSKAGALADAMMKERPLPAPPVEVKG